MSSKTESLKKRMRHMKKIISFLTILCCLAGSLLPAYAAESGTGSGAPRVTFINEPNNSPDLFVDKIVENAVPGAQYAAPEHAAYRFVLKIGGKIAANEEYRLLDAEHGELTRKTSSGNKISFRTDSSGVFTLEAGQQAWFEYVGTGVKYEVIELDTYLCPVTDDDGGEVSVSGGYGLYDGDGNKLRDEIEYQMRSLSVDGYRQVSPPGNQANEASTGEKSILANGSSETFTNRYTGRGTGDRTVLEISKSVSFPAGYAVPETPDFQFRVELDGSPYAGKEYTIIDTASGNPVVHPETGLPCTGMTDGNGCFTLKGGQTASFQEIPTELDYKVYELLGEGIQTAAEDEITDDGKSADNRSADDGKNADNRSADDGKNADNRSVNGGSAGDENADGNAAYASGQDAGTGFGKWWAVGGTERKGSTQAPLTAVNFHNANTSFVVTKRMEDYSKPDIVFTFRLADEKNNAFTGAVYYLYNTTGVPIYDGEGNQVTGITDGEGAFQLKPGQSAVFVGIEPGKSFRVSEAKNPEYTQVLPLPNSDTTYTVPAGGNIPFVDFVNKPEDNTGSLTVTKELTYKDGEGPLNNDDFHFVLYKQLKTEADVQKALGITEILFFTTGNVTPEKIDAAAADGSIVLVPSEIPGGDAAGDAGDTGDPSGTGEASEICESIRIVEGTCYYLKDGTLYELYAPVEDAVYSVPEGLSAPTYKTGSGDNAGGFSIKAGQTAKFELLKAGYRYLVKEFGLKAEYTEVTASDYYKKIYVLPQAAPDSDAEQAAGQYAQAAELTGNGLSFLFTNHYEAKKVNLSLLKADAEGNAITESQAHFMLYLDKEKKNPAYEEEYFSTDGEGKLTFPDLKPGTYWLYELKAPSGYRLLESPVELSIGWDEDGNPAVTIDGKPLNVDGDVIKDGHIEAGAVQGNQGTPDGQDVQDGQDTQDGQDVQDGQDTLDSKNEKTVITANSTICITVINKDFYKLPSAGGAGIYWYSIGGMLLMMAAVLILYKNKRTGEVLRD